MIYHRTATLITIATTLLSFTAPALRAADFKVEEQVVGPALSNPPNFLARAKWPSKVRPTRNR